ncbi:MAG: Holliday junction resolvase RuvX [Bacteroidetes bacterium]|nr:Holliday junction resolvase RuvX [Bacteroidota bacterium]
MGRIMAIDYGRKRTGIAVTDENRIIATGLDTVATKDIFDFLGKYLKQENVDVIVVGEPRQMDNTQSESEQFIQPFVKRLHKLFPDLRIERFDERFTSKMAFRTMIDAGISRKARQDKATIDKISATILLQSYMNSTQKPGY